MNNDKVTSITCVSDYHCEKFLRYLPAGPLPNGSVRERPLIQFYRDRFIWNNRERYGFMHTICPDDIIRVKGFTDAQLLQKIIQVRRQVTEAAAETVEAKPKKKIKRRKHL